MDTIIKTEKSPNFECKSCDYICSKHSDYIKHTKTAKHAKMEIKYIQNTKQNDYFCECGKQYSYHSGLWKHKKTCDGVATKSPICEKNYIDNHEPTNNEIIEILKVQMVENQELRNFMMEQQKQMMEQMMEQQKQMIDLASKSSVTNTINSNSNCNNNNTFNLQVFLNEKCKDALNINEFVDSIKIQISDLENFAHVDYPDGISKIFVKNLNNVDTYLRPIHCSDLKREVLYIKNNNEWVKETDDKTLLKNAIKKIANKNIRQINEWVKEHPGCQDPRTKQNVKYNKIVMNSMSGGTVEEQQENMEQIVKNVTKAVVIDKYTVK
uniref:C2H2-type domain-containing protein n=1 Tax=viral metagenome TaxID=1070528 RepID=A0A6C0I7U5_9ZZZZ